MSKIIRTKTSTGEIASCPDKQMEWLYIGDYMQHNNIKADFLGLTKEIKNVEHFKVDLKNKLVVTISTQKGCPMKCTFCDVPKYGYKGNIRHDDLLFQIKDGIENSGCKETNRLNIHFARMGEPSFNKDVLEVSRTLLNEDLGIDAKVIHPVFTTMLPKTNKHLEERILKWCDIKNNDYNGEAGLQLSINTTNEEQRNKDFNGMSLSLDEISKIAAKLPMPVGRKYTLNFAVDEKSEIDVDKLNQLFDKEKFIVKLTPIHATVSALENEFGIIANDFNVYKKLEQPLLEAGWDVLVFIPSKEEDEDRITCGNMLMSINDFK